MRTLLLLLGLLFLLGNKQNKEYIGDGVLIPVHEYVPIYSDKGINVIDSIINDTLKESYPFIYIYKVEDNYAKVKVLVFSFSEEEMPIVKGWMSTHYIGTNLNNYCGITPIRNLPNDSSEIVFEIADAQWGDFYEVLDAQDKWLKIRNIYNPEEIGWLAPEYQCNSRYTACN